VSERVKLAAHTAAKYDQGHLDRFLKPYHKAESDFLARDILSLDMGNINKTYNSIIKAGKSEDADFLLEPPEVMVKYEVSEAELRELSDTGSKFIAEGRFAAVTMAGGQGTRLGHDGPKGTFVLPLKEPRSLFQIQCEGLKRVGDMAGNQIPWFIMTSRGNHEATVDFFRENSYFGYDKNLVRFFSQNEVPVVDLNGKLLVRDNCIVRAPDGNGGIFAALASSGNLEIMERSGVEKVFVCGIDNALIRMADPVFLGYAIRNGKQLTSKSVLKRSFDEKAGVFVRRNGKPYYIEYTEIPEDKAAATDRNGNLLFGDIGIVAYVYDTALLKNLADKPLPYHSAIKKIPFCMPDGTLIEPDKPNAVKFESFIFDSFDYVDDIAVMRADRSEEFAPIKNRTGEDSPEVLAGRSLL
jgi:UDP-N-acetylglucosamine pyrophosphorylase